MKRNRLSRRLRRLGRYQGGWVQLLWFIVSLIITIVLSPKPAQPKPAALEDFDLPVAEESRSLPVIFGKVRITGANITWYGALASNRIKKSSMFSSTTVGYRYFLGMMMHFCRGPVDSFTRIEAADKTAWLSEVTENGLSDILVPDLFGGEKREGGLVGKVNFMFGGPTQVAPDFLKANVAGPYPGFRGVSGLMYYSRGSIGIFRKYVVPGAGGFVGTTPYVKPWAVTATRILKGWYNDTCWYPEAAEVDGGMNAAHVIYEALTNPQWGGKNAISSITDDNFRYVADVCKAENLGLHIIWNASTKIEDFIRNVLDHIAGILGFDPRTGKYLLILVRGDYDAGDLPLFNNSNMGEIVSFQHRSWGETVNQLTIAYTDPDSGKATDITVQDLGNIRSQKVRIPDKIDRSAIANHETIRAIAGRELAARSTPLARIDFKCNRSAFPVLPGGVIRITRTEPELELNETVFRIIDIKAGRLEDGEMTVNCVEDIYALSGMEYAVDEPPVNDEPPIEPPPPDPPDSSGSVTSSTVTVPPGPTELVDGQRFLIPVGATDEWAPHVGEIAEWDEDSADWIYIVVPDNVPITDQETGGQVEVYQGEVRPVGLGNVLTTKGDLLTHSGTGLVRTPVGADGLSPMADAGSPNGWVWGDPLWRLPLAAKGDLLSHDGVDAAVVPIGAEGTSPVARAASPAGFEWEAPVDQPLVIINEATVARAVTATDYFRKIRFTNAASIAYTVPENATLAVPANTVIGLYQAAGGQITISPAGAAVVNVPDGKVLKTRAQGAFVALHKVATDTWDLVGDLEDAP